MSISSRMTGGYSELEGDERPSRSRLMLKILFVCLLIAALIGFVTWLAIYIAWRAPPPRPAPPPAPDTRTPYTFADLFNGRFVARSVAATWSSEEAFARVDRSRNIWMVDVSGGERLLVNNSLLALNTSTGARANWQSYALNVDSTLVLLSYNQASVWRHSFTADWVVVEVRTQSTVKVPLPAAAANAGTGGAGPRIMNVQWNPSAQHSSVLAFASGYNIYVWDSAQVGTAPAVVTADGQWPSVLNGVQSWVYEEEIFGDGSALWWSPDGAAIAFLRSDESAVPEFEFPYYDFPPDPYTTPVRIKYPKAGAVNPVVELAIARMNFDDAAAGASGRISCAVLFCDYQAATGLPANETYVVGVAWPPVVGALLNSSFVSFSVLNRAQNNETTFFGDVRTGAARAVFLEKPLLGWLETRPLVFLNAVGSNSSSNNSSSSSSAHFLHLQVSPQSRYQHIALYNYSDSAVQFVRFLTDGAWEVTEICGFHVASQRVFFIAAMSPMNRHLYSLDIGVAGSVPLALTSGEAWNSASFSPSGGSFLLFSQGPQALTLPPSEAAASNYGVPQTRLRSSTDASLDVLLEANQALQNTLAATRLPRKEYRSDVPSATGDMLNAWVLYPPDFVASRKYPVLVTVYGGPGSQNVQKTYAAGGWDTYVASQLQTIVVAVDGRGTGARGDDFLKATHRQLGILETADQLAAARFLATLPFVDASRMAIWGWSYGGFMAAMCMSDAANRQASGSLLFRAGISVAPVTDWHLYDSVYTERYMDVPSNNTAGYDRSSVLLRADKFSGDFLLMHGSGDDNVHFQNSAELELLLVSSGFQFEYHVYSNKDHSMGTARRHLYHLLSNFLREHLISPLAPAPDPASK